MEPSVGHKPDTKVRKKLPGSKPKLETLESIFFALKKSENGLNTNPEASELRKDLA